MWAAGLEQKDEDLRTLKPVENTHHAKLTPERRFNLPDLVMSNLQDSLVYPKNTYLRRWQADDRNVQENSEMVRPSKNKYDM